jgi:hypothetical protein
MASAFMLTCALASAQRTSDFSLRRTAFSGGAIGNRGGSFSLGATIAEGGVVGAVAGGQNSIECR